MFAKRAAAAALVALVAVASVSAQMYKEGHWDYVTKLDSSNFDTFVKNAIDNGQTAMAPAWNAITKEYKSHPDVVFGDVNLSKDPVGREHEPGKGGWPTVKYFNADTGVGGAPYQKKTNKAMCDELGNVDNMRNYVIDAANVLSCDVSTLESCSKIEKDYINQWNPKSTEDKSKEAERLAGLMTQSQNFSLAAKKWIKKRNLILKSMLVNAPNKDEL